MSTYTLDRPQKGLALIINNLHNEQKATRKDVEKLEKMFEKINVQTEETKINQSQSQLRTTCAGLKSRNFEDYNIFFLVVLSHGDRGDKIKCHHSGYFDVEEFVESLSKNVTMIGYPKFLFFDFCRGNNINVGELKVEDPKFRIPFGSDIFIGFATTTGYASVTAADGSPFIAALCSSMEKLYNQKTFNYIFQEVQSIVSKQSTIIFEPSKNSTSDAMQVPESRSTLRNHLYLMEKGLYRQSPTFLPITKSLF